LGGEFFGALFENLETIGPMIGEIGLHVVCTRVRCVRWGKKGQRFKKGKGKVEGWVVGKRKKKGGGEERVLNENEI
jgi:hypothetical protein